MFISYYAAAAAAAAHNAALEMRATSLEALSLLHIALPLTRPPFVPPPNTPLTSLPANIPVPPPLSPNAHCLPHLLRTLSVGLYAALSPSHLYLPQVLAALHPVVLRPGPSRIA